MRSISILVVALGACVAPTASITSAEIVDEEVAIPIDEGGGPYDDWYDYRACRDAAMEAANTCSAACAQMYPPGSDPSPDASCPAGEFRGPMALAYLSCHTDCEIIHANAQVECCTWGVVDGRPIDWTDPDGIGPVCRGFACSTQIEPQYGQCLANYGGYTQQNVFGHACKMDVFGFCDPIWNDGCGAEWRPPQLDCDAALPDDFGALVAKLSDPRFLTREAAERTLSSELAETINDHGAACGINVVKGALDARIANADPEARWRLSRIRSSLF